MTIEECINLCSDPKALKNQLREALCFVLKVEYKPLDYRPSNDILARCKSIFCKKIYDKTNVSYHYAAYEGKYLLSILRKIKDLEPEQNDDRIVSNFVYIIDNLPDWYIQHNYRLATIDKCFDIIVSQLLNNNNNGKIDMSYKRKIANELFK